MEYKEPELLDWDNDDLFNSYDEDLVSDDEDEGSPEDSDGDHASLKLGDDQTPRKSRNPFS